MSARRVVITGIGLVTPLGADADSSWRRLVAGESGLVAIDRFRVDDLPAKIAGLIPTEGDGAFKSDAVMSAKDVRRNDPFILYGIAAASEAIEDSGWKPQSEEARYRTGVMIGSGIGGLGTIADTAIDLEKRGPRRVSPFFIPASLINLVSGQVSIRFGLKGPNHAVVTACSTGAHAIGDATQLIAANKADVMVAGGAEGAVCRLGIAGFAAMKALSTSYNDTPRRASR
ncbi:MAG: beta-ketoacyl synthase N-terminal-like domain-containing protein, partial [Geminicoccaceae bacterium]